MSRGYAIAGVFCALALLTGCRLDAFVTVELKADGSGLLRIEAMADEELRDRAARFGDEDPVVAFRTGDLEEVGWTVTRYPDEGRLLLERPFRTAEELAALVAGLDPGTSTPVLQGFTLEHERSLFSSTYAFAGRVDLSQGGSSEPVEALLEGFDRALVERIAGADLERAFHFTLRVVLPGRVTSSNAPHQERGALEWVVEPGQAVSAGAASTQRNWLAVGTAAGVAALLLVTLALSVAVAMAARSRRRVRQ